MIYIYEYHLLMLNHVNVNVDIKHWLNWFVGCTKSIDYAWWTQNQRHKNIDFCQNIYVICPKCIDKKSGYTFMNLIFWSQIRLRYQIRKHLMPKDQAQCKRWYICKRIVILFWWFSSLEVNPGLCGAFYPFPNHSLKIIKHFVI